MPAMFPLQVLPGPVPQFPPRQIGIEQGSPAQRWISGESGEVWQKRNPTKCCVRALWLRWLLSWWTFFPFCLLTPVFSIPAVPE